MWIGFIARRAPGWLLASLGTVLVGGAAVGGLVQSGVLGGSGAVTAEQAVVIDKASFTARDVTGGATDKAVTVNGEGTVFTVAGEFHVGEVLAVDVPLANRSNADANVRATLEAPRGLLATLQAFWHELTRSATPSQSLTTPAPAPLTAITPQSSDTVPVAPGDHAPPGTSGVMPQLSDTTGTSSSPGLPASAPQPKDTSPTLTKPTGVQDNTPQNPVVSSTHDASEVPGSAAVNPQTSNSALTTSVPAGLTGLTSSRSIHFVAKTVAPTGAAPVAPQVADTVATTSRPVGAPVSLSGTWYGGHFWVDVDGDGTLRKVEFLLTDTSVAGAYDTLDLSTYDGVYGRGVLNDGVTGLGDDERLTATADVRLGPFYTFSVSFDADPTADSDDAHITAKTWFVASIVGTDLDADGIADDVFFAALTDDDSDGLYERLDLSIGDDTFGEGDLGDGLVDFAAANNTNDERLSGAASVTLGAYTFLFNFAATPFRSPLR